MSAAKSERPPIVFAAPTATPRTASGKHPAITGYRTQLKAIAENAVNSTRDLDKELSEYLASLINEGGKDPESEG